MGEAVGRHKSLGELEHLLLLAVMRLGEEAYGVTLRREIEARTGRPVSLGSIYPTLDRLEAIGYVSSRMSDPTGERGGRRRRTYRLEPAGEAAVRRARDMLEAMWEGFEPERAGEEGAS
ncbi:MAG: PadR family transcriptional regulator [Gemmatimonadetes bacterium]|nr:MAG: PadR family transcriptional regulator [Gemmatimonadota bacterium]